MPARSLFPGKVKSNRFQGELTAIGGRDFEAARRRIAKCVDWQELVSHADAVETMARAFRFVTDAELATVLGAVVIGTKRK